MSDSLPSRRRPRASLHTLGCRLNQSETLALREKLTEAGYEIVPFVAGGRPGDHQHLYRDRAGRLQVPPDDPATSSSATRKPSPRWLAATRRWAPRRWPESTGWTSSWAIRTSSACSSTSETGPKTSCPSSCAKKIDRRDFTMNFAGERPFNQRANLKVQDGCDFVCSFCIIPFARGRARSRDLADLMREVDSQVSRGVRELVLTGVNIGTYANAGLDVLGPCRCSRSGGRTRPHPHQQHRADHRALGAL